MKKFLLSLSLLMLAGLGASAQISFTPFPGLPESIHIYKSAGTGYDGRFDYMAPAWFIFPDGPCTPAEAEALVEEIGLNGDLKDYVSLVAVIGPANGVSYDREKDFAAYEAIFNRIRVFVNLKVVGIGAGATFVNEAIAPAAWEVADILSIDGKPARKQEGTATVPAYLAGKDAAKAAKAYIGRDSALPVENGKTLKVYQNPEEPLLQVIVNTRPGTLRETVADAWDRLLSRNYRCSNLRHTGYMGGTLGQYGNYELEPYLMWERLGTRREKVEQSLFTYNKKEDLYLWYEYIPASLEKAPAGSMPLVILLHGHNNDPRTQAETSGFVELGAAENFLVAELEWQGKDAYAYMGDHGIEAVVRELLRKYPQLDPSRVYAEGLSAGGFSATALGVTKSHLFAAVGAHSGGLFSSGLNLGFPFMDPDALQAEAAQKAGKVRMPYFSIGGTADDGVPFLDPALPNGLMLADAWRMYQKLNGLPVSGPSDLERYPVFGLPLENLHRIETAKGHAMQIGDLSDREGHPLIRIVAVEDFGHWNFVPGAREMWEFFKLWEKDPVTGNSIYRGETQTELYLDAKGGENVSIQISQDAEPETLADLQERLLGEKMPLEIKAFRTKWAETPRTKSFRKSWGAVQKETFAFAIKGTDTLKLDVYRQPGFDSPRPIILYSFGGGWQRGSRDMMDNPLFPFYTPMAQLGYVVVAIDYRLGYAAAQERGEAPSGDIVQQMVSSKGTEQEAIIIGLCRKACLDAVEDLFDATSYVVEHATEWGGDASRIVLCGGSAGACNSIQAEYLLANEAPLALEHLPEGFRYGGVIPCAGAIFPGGEPLTWKRKPSPILFFHGTADPIVPYGEGADFMGPTAIIASLPDRTPYVLYSAKDQDHVMASLPTGYMNHAIAAFIERYVIQGEQSALTVEESLIDRSDPLAKQYLLSGYHYPKEEVVRFYESIYGPSPK